MRFHSFEFKHYAGFEERALSFDSDKRLHVILGPNEAGKSRLLRGFSRFLFGLPRQNDADQFGVIGSKSKLMAEVTIDAQRAVFERSKSTLDPIKSLTAGVSATLLSAALEGLSEKQFLNLHALSHDQLRQGGLELMGGKGSMGQSLFAVSAGLSPMQKRISAYEKCSKELYLKSASKPEINQLLKERADLQQALKASDFNQQRYAELTGKLTRATDEKDDLARQLETKRAQLGQVMGASKLQAALDAQVQDFDQLVVSAQALDAKLNDSLLSLGIDRGWLDTLNPNLMVVIGDMCDDMEAAMASLDAAQNTVGQIPQAIDRIEHLNIAELTDLPDIQALQHQLQRVQEDLSVKTQKAELISQQLGLPPEDKLQLPSPTDMRDLQDKMRDLIQDKRALDTSGANLETELRTAQSRQLTLTEDAPEVDTQLFDQKQKARDAALRQAINALADQEATTAIKSITQAQALIVEVDKLSELRMGKADEIAHLSTLDETIRKLNAQQAGWQDELANWEAQKADLQAVWQSNWAELGLEIISMRDYSEWQRLAETLESLKRNIQDLRGGIAEHEQALKIGEEKIASLYKKWHAALASGDGVADSHQQKQRLSKWAVEVQTLQANFESHKVRSQQVEVAQRRQDMSLAKLNAELLAVGLSAQPSPAISIQFKKKLAEMLAIKANLDQETSRKDAIKHQIAELNVKADALDISQEAQADPADLQREADALQDAFSQAKQQQDGFALEIEAAFASNDPLRLESKIALLEEQIAEKVRLYQLNAGAAQTLKSSLETYIQSLGQGLLEKASAHMKCLTNGRYERLSIDGLGETSSWTLIDKAGEEVPSTGLSDGTRDQLFLAMRMSFLADSSLPFIADDLFINFDDERSSAAFKRLATALPNSQLFYFTHHEHLAGVASQALGSQNVEIVRLN